jgi:geranylgeranyl pyrophosphate synthase
MVSEGAKKLSEFAVRELQRRSTGGLALAKKIMLAEKIESGRLREALEYYALNWNDFTHPGLFSLACEAVGGHPHRAVQVQAAITMLAAAFDVHDDIVDESRQKNSTPTVFGKYGKDISILLGDAFLIKGFAVFCKSLETRAQKDTCRIVDALQTTMFELGNAHALELDLRGKANADPQEYMRVVEMKGAGIEVDIRIGAEVGGGSGKEVEILTRCGRNLGVLATLRQEFIDIFDVEELNQRIQGKYLPIPILYAMKNKKTERTLGKLFAGGMVTEDDVDHIVRAVFEDRKVKRLRDMMDDLAAESLQLTTSICHEKLAAEFRNLISSMTEDL